MTSSISASTSTTSACRATGSRTKWDGFNVSINSRTEEVTEDHGVLKGKALAFHVGAAGNAVPIDDLPR